MTALLAAVQAALDELHSRPEPLAGKVLGLIGYGDVGREIARRAARCGMRVVYSDPVPGRGPHQRVLLSELLARSDIVIPLNGDPARLTHADLAALMKPGARLVRLPAA